MGRRHATNAVALGCDVYGVDPNPVARDSLRVSHPQIECSTNLPDRCDAMIVASPAPSHLHWASEAARRAIPCFVEKPLGLTTSLKLWARHPASSGVQVGYNLRFHQAPLTMLGLIRDGHIGDLIAGRFVVASHLSEWGGDAATYASALLECSHELDAALWLMGAARVAGALSTGDGIWDILLRHESGMMSAVHLNYLQRDYRRGWCLIGTTGTVYWDWSSTRETMVFIKRHADQVERYWHADPMEALDASYRAELTHFLHAVQTNHFQDSTLDDGLAVLRLGAQAESFAADQTARRRP